MKDEDNIFASECSVCGKTFEAHSGSFKECDFLNENVIEYDEDEQWKSDGQKPSFTAGICVCDDCQKDEHDEPNEFDDNF